MPAKTFQASARCPPKCQQKKLATAQLVKILPAKCQHTYFGIFAGILAIREQLPGCVLLAKKAFPRPAPEILQAFSMGSVWETENIVR